MGRQWLSPCQSSPYVLLKGTASPGIYTRTPLVPGSKLNKLITDQNGKCAISGAVLVFQQFSDNQASVDRIDDNLGYVDENCRLVCLEFNTAVKWSRKLLVESIALSGIPPDNFEIETSDLETVLTTARKKGAVLRKWTVLTKNGIETVFCHDCSETKPRYEFNKKISNGCKVCVAQWIKRHRSAWRGALDQLIHNAKNSTKLRNKHRKEDDQSQCTLTYLELVAILKAQGGMCAYSRVALSPQMGNWKVSLERKDVRLGYREYAVPATYSSSASGSMRPTAVCGQRVWCRGPVAGVARSSCDMQRLLQLEFVLQIHTFIFNVAGFLFIQARIKILSQINGNEVSFCEH